MLSLNYLWGNPVNMENVDEHTSIWGSEQSLKLQANFVGNKSTEIG